MRAIINISILCLLAIGAFAQSTNTYEYDNLNRLTKVTYANGAVVQYSYDNVGNRLTKNVAGVYVNHTISAEANPAEGGTVTGGGTYLGGTTCTLTATANEGYTFVNWTKNGSQVSTSPSYTFTVTADASYVANFEAVGVEYAITAEANPAEGGTVTGGGTYLGGTTCTLTATANTGYTFINWTENGEEVSTENPYSFTVTGDRALVANFTLSGLPVPTDGLIAYYPFDGNADDYSGNGNHGTIIGNVVSAPDRFGNPNSAYRFPGEAFNYISVPDADILHLDAFTLSAWVYTDAEDYGGGYLINKGRDIYNGSYRLYVRGIGATTQYGGTNDVSVEENPTVGQWHLITGTVEGDYARFYIDGVLQDEKTLSGTFSCNNTEPLTLGAHYYSGVPTFWAYTLNGVMDEVRIYNRVLTQQEVWSLYGFDAEEGLVVYYPFDGDADDYSGNGYHATPYNSYQYEGGVIGDCIAVEGAGYTGSNGGHVMLPELDFGNSSGVTLNLWVKSLGLSHNDGEAYINFGLDSETDRLFIFQQPDQIKFAYHEAEISIPNESSYADNWVMFSLTCDESGLLKAYVNGTVMGEESVTFDGINTSLAALGRHWWSSTTYTRFIGSFDEVRIYNRALTQQELQLLYGIVQMRYEITATANPEEGGTVSGAGEYDYGTECTLTATLAEGYSFMNWTENGQTVSSENPYSFTVTGNRALVANFTLPLAITATANPEEGGTVSGGGTFEFGETCTLTATANEGYTFINWTENGQTVSTENSYSFTVTGDRALVANFVEEGDLCAITFDLYDSYGDGWTGNRLVVTEDTGWSFELTLDGGSSGTQTLMLVDGSHVTLTWINGSWTNECSFTVSYSNGNVIYHGSDLNADFSYGFDVDCEGMPALSFDIMASANPVEGGTVSGAGTYNYGSTCTLTATANTGYTFVNWTKNGTAVSTNPTYNFTVTESASYVANFGGSATTQTTSFIEGWNWWSSYIELTGIDGLGQLESSLGGAGLMVKSRSDGYVEPYEYNGTTNWYGTLTGIVNEQMYKVRTNTVCNALITGTVVVAAEHPINIGEGWNWIGFPSSQNVSLSLAMSGFTPEANDVIKGRYSYSTYFSDGGTSMWYGTLNSLEPGQGYMYYSNSEGTKTLTFNVERGETIVDNIVSEDNIYRPAAERFSDNMTVTAVVQFGGQELRNDGYEVAAFVGEECRGSVTLMYVEPIDRYVAFLSIFGEASECISFKLTDGSVTYLSDTQIVFAPDGVVGNLSVPFVLDFGIQSVGGDDSVPLRVYPNPSKDVFHVESADIRRVDVFNSLGQVILSKEVSDESVSFDLKGCAPGSYQLRVVTGRGVQNCRIIKE